MKELIEEITAILVANQSPIINSVGDTTGEVAVLSENYYIVSEQIESLIQAITDPENQPNQYGIKL